MALIFTDSFQFGWPSFECNEKWGFSQFGNFSATVSGRTGNAWIGNGEWMIHQDVANTHATFICGFAQKYVSTMLNEVRFRNHADNIDHVTFKVDTITGAINVYRGTSAGTLLGSTAAGVIHSDGSWQYVELKATLSDTTGTVVIRVDEAVVLNLSGLDTKNGGTASTFDALWVQPGSVAHVDDLYLCNGAGSVNNDFLGAVRIEMLKPNGNGNSSGMTNDAGNSTNNYSHVDDDAPFVETDWVEGSTQEDTYAFQDSGQPTGNSCKGVAVYAWAEKTDAGARGLSVVARSGASESALDVGSLVNGIYHLKGRIFETKPGGGAWLVSDVNAAEFGLQAT